MKHLAPLLLIILAFVFATPKELCVCAQKVSVIKAAQAEHSCCESMAPSTNCDAALIGGLKDCCGMAGKGFPVLATSVGLLNSDHSLKTAFIGNLTAPGITGEEHGQSIADANRAPPIFCGFGSTKTYLFKRVFLI